MSKRDKVIKALREVWDDDSSSVLDALQAYGLQARSVYGFEPACYVKVWEPAEIDKQDSSGSRILSHLFFTLYEAKSDHLKHTAPFMFVAGRMGNTLNVAIS